MQLVDVAAFEKWCADHGIRRSAKYPRSENLVYPPEPSVWSRYRPNTTPHGLGLFVERAVQVAAVGEPVLAFPTWRGGHWWPVMFVESWHCQALAAVVRGVGIPDGYVGAVRFEPNRLSSVALLLTTALQYTGASFWELTVIPDHARCIIHNDEDGDLVGTFPGEPELWSYTDALKKAGWDEPTEPDPRVSETDPWLDLDPPTGASDGAA